ncbi:MAG: hypothetical protein M1470_02990 [Bacteroidetes bacterium]|nr:hypothetical protein [Bacteroidota bacterium]MCL5739224.1 hypothetical protein [Bacteroidota bacterium]
MKSLEARLKRLEDIVSPREVEFIIEIGICEDTPENVSEIIVIEPKKPISDPRRKTSKVSE